MDTNGRSRLCWNLHNYRGNHDTYLERLVPIVSDRQLYCFELIYNSFSSDSYHLDVWTSLRFHK